MPTNTNFNIPFLGGGPSIAEQILQGLHEGFTEKQQKQELGLQQQRVQNETQRNQVLNRYTQAQLEHEGMVTAYENETNPIKKHQLLTDLQDATLKLGIAKHSAKYFGIDADALTNAAQATDTSATPPKTTSTGTAGPSPFEMEMQNTEKLLGQMSPDEQAIWDNAKTVASRTMSAAPVSAAIGKISEQRQAVHKAELETTAFKDWKGQFARENGRQPNTAEIEHFQTLGARIGADTKLEVNSKEMYDTKENSVVQMNSKEINDANQQERGRYIQYTGQVQNALKAQSNVNDIRDGISMMRDAINAPGFKLSDKARALMTLANRAPEHALEAVTSGMAAEHLSEPEQNYVIAHATLVDRAFSLKGLQSQGGGGSDSQRAAIAAMVPGFATADKGMAEKYLKTLENNIRNVEKAYPKIGSSRTSAREEAGGEAGGPPKGATMKVPGSDGKLHWSDGKVDLGVAE